MKRSNFQFVDVGIAVGSVIEFFGMGHIKAVVLVNNKIFCRGEITSLSAAAKKILGKSELQGPRFWVYEGETLLARRDRMDAGKF